MRKTKTCSSVETVSKLQAEAASWKERFHEVHLKFGALENKYDLLRLKKPGEVVELEERLEVCLQESEERRMRNEELRQMLDVQKSESSKEKDLLKDKIRLLEEEVKHERRRATQALDVAESTSHASSGIGRLLHSIVDKDVMEELRISSQERREKARESMRHRRPV